MLWHDNCMIPLHAEHPADALEWVNFYYRPRIEAMITDWVGYVSPVPKARPLIAGELDDPSTAESPLIFPPSSMFDQLHAYYDFKGISDHDVWTGLFDPIIQS